MKDSQEGSVYNDPFLQLLIRTKYRLVRHLSLIILLGAGIYNSKVIFEEPVNTFLKILILSVLLFLFYINMYLLVPKLLFNDKYLGYFMWLIVLFVIIVALAFNARHFFSAYMKPEYKLDDDPNLFAFSFIFFISIGASTSVKLFQRWIVDTQRINKLETATAQSELEQLKNQINPHFLFNTLNNVNVLTRQDPEKASQVVMKLSDLLRYQLYDSVRSSVFLTADIHFLEDFLNLEKIRRDQFEFTISPKGELGGVQVPPLLFITFVENAVKHNLDPENSSYVELFFEVKNNTLHFKCSNSKPQMPIAANASSGLGLTNVTRRLELLYPGRHNLIINDVPGSFTVSLTIKL